MSRKSKRAYELFFQWFKLRARSRGYVINWQRFMTDFESGLMPALESHFPEVDRRGCKFHFCQAIMKKVSDIGLKPLYSAPNVRFKTFVRSIFSLSFLPLQKIIFAFEGLVQSLDFQNTHPQWDLILNFVQYLWETWIKDGSRFPKAKWNSLGLSDRRTNNDIEGYHYAATSRYGKTKHLWHFINAMKDEIVSYEREIRMIQAGNPPTVRRKEQRRRETRISNMLADYQSANGVYANDLQFLAAMSHLEIDL